MGPKNADFRKTPANQAGTKDFINIMFRLPEKHFHLYSIKFENNGCSCVEAGSGVSIEADAGVSIEANAGVPLKPAPVFAFWID